MKLTPFLILVLTLFTACLTGQTDTVKAADIPLQTQPRQLQQDDSKSVVGGGRTGKLGHPAFTSGRGFVYVPQHHHCCHQCTVVAKGNFVSDFVNPLGLLAETAV